MNKPNKNKQTEKKGEEKKAQNETAVKRRITKENIRTIIGCWMLQRPSLLATSCSESAWCRHRIICRLYTAFIQSQLSDDLYYANEVGPKIFQCTLISKEQARARAHARPSSHNSSSNNNKQNHTQNKHKSPDKIAFVQNVNLLKNWMGITIAWSSDMKRAGRVWCRHCVLADNTIISLLYLLWSVEKQQFRQISETKICFTD